MSETKALITKTKDPRLQRYGQAAALLRQWLTDEDENDWEEIEEEIKDSKTCFREMSSCESTGNKE